MRLTDRIMTLLVAVLLAMAGSAADARAGGAVADCAVVLSDSTHTLDTAGTVGSSLLSATTLNQRRTQRAGFVQRSDAADRERSPAPAPGAALPRSGLLAVRILEAAFDRARSHACGSSSTSLPPPLP